MRCGHRRRQWRARRRARCRSRSARSSARWAAGQFARGLAAAFGSDQGGTNRGRHRNRRRGSHRGGAAAVRRHHHRRGPGRPPARTGRLTKAGMNVALDRAQAVRRHLREHRVHADQDARRERLRGAPGAGDRPTTASCFPFRSMLSMPKSGTRGCGVSELPFGCRRWLRNMERWTVFRGHPGSTRRCRARRRGAADRPAHLHQRRRPRVVTDMPGIGDISVLTNDILALDRIPRHLVVVGGS